MAITFSGEFTSPRTPDEVYDFLCDPNKFAPLLPDFESMSVQDATHFAVKVRVGVGNIRGSAEIKMELAESVRPSRAQYKGRGNAVGSQVTVSAGFDLSAIEAGTKIAWQGEAGVFGKLASMAGGMLEPLGKKNIQKLIDGLQWALTWPPAQAVMPEVPRAAVLSASAEQPGQAPPQPPPDEVVQGASAPQPNGPAAGELAGAGLENISLQQPANPAAAEMRGDHDDSPQSETKVAQDVSPR